MRIWSLHPCYLDPQGLVALWRETLLAQAVLWGETKGYRHHPQLLRFQQSPSPKQAIAAYLRAVHAEAKNRGYQFDARKIRSRNGADLISVTRGQLCYEWKHLKAKLKRRSPEWLKSLKKSVSLRAHPLFRIVSGEVENWEIVQP